MVDKASSMKDVFMFGIFALSIANFFLAISIWLRNPSTEMDKALKKLWLIWEA